MVFFQVLISSTSCEYRLLKVKVLEQQYVSYSAYEQLFVQDETLWSACANIILGNITRE